MERVYLLDGLLKEILGPRGGVNERLDERHNPKDEYITGVLAPVKSGIERDIDAEAELASAEDNTDEADQDTGKVEVVSGISPALDPKTLPKSLGLSFVIRIGDDASLELCFSWARYRKDGQEWCRVPYYHYKVINVPKDSKWADSKDESVEFSIRSYKIDLDTYRVSIFMKNNTPVEEDEKARTENCIFQPQIRINCGENSKLIPIESRGFSVDTEDASEQEEMSLEMMYSERPAMARGHLVGVTWRDIDPQRSHPNKKLPEKQPFYWIDSQIVPEEIKKKFIECDIRTDYTPVYPIEAPDMNWREEYGPVPDFNPLVLSECWQAEEIRHSLTPLVNGYKTWLKEQEMVAKKVEPVYKKIAKTQLQKIEQSIQRIERAIDLLCTDSDTRLAFCFANKVIAVQSIWGKKKVYPWRPFQLAFILQNIPSIANDFDKDREIADLLWFATGGGKTESYLGLAIFTIALMRRRAEKDRAGHKKGTGVNVLSRYTLRLLTIQQFRRTLRVITAAEYLRVEGLKKDQPVGWRPKNCGMNDSYIWGTERFSVGLWVGGGVTPNSIHTIKFRNREGKFDEIFGAIDLLKGKKASGEPAQVVNCPCCDTYLAIPSEGLGPGKHTVHLLFKGGGIKEKPEDIKLSISGAESVQISSLITHNNVYHTISLDIDIRDGQRVKSEAVDRLWKDIKQNIGNNIELQSARATRPGYFIRTFITQQNTSKAYGFDISCPNPDCNLNDVHWAEKVPVSVASQYVSQSSDMEFQEVFEAFKVPGNPNYSTRLLIPAYTVDDQIYHRCPSMIIGTVDKFAQLPYEPKSASIFGNVEYYHARWGYYRENCPPSDGSGSKESMQGHPPGIKRNPLHKRVKSFIPPSLIIQDELHLIEGPLGSMFGLYEMAIDELCTRYEKGERIIPKCIVSTATVRQASNQVKSLFTREFSQFPPAGISVNDNFFSTTSETHPLDSENAGRLYVGICAPGRGAQTPLVRIWSSLLQKVKEIRDDGHSTPEQLDGFWTLVGYFNAIRELAGAAGLYRQDIPERMNFMYGKASSRVMSDSALELSSRCDSMELPGLLDQLSTELTSGTPEDGVLATSMFGTGVDVDRLRLMIINGQPKSTSSYIQASGRVGRKLGGLVVTFFRASRPRDLDHYEFFTGYHRALYKFVEPISVAPFSPRAREKALGPLIIALLRNAKDINGTQVSSNWRYQQKLSGRNYASAARYIKDARNSAEIRMIQEIIEQRVRAQPEGRRPEIAIVLSELASEIDRWHDLARLKSDLLFNESSMINLPQHPVVLGDLQHFFQNLEVAFENSPQSLRDVEGTLTFKC